MIEVIEATLRVATPLVLAGMGGFLCERSGIATICLEGVLLTSAWAAATVTYFSHNPYLGALAGLIVGSLTMGLHGFLTITAKANHIISGVAVNLLAAGITPLLTKIIFGSPTNTQAIPMMERFPSLPLMIIAFALPLVIHQMTYSTGLGLRLLAAGDGPHALKTAGISPQKVRYVALTLAGAIVGLGGVYLSTCHASQFTREMSAGRGFIALAALIFGKWKPMPTFLTCLFFGLTDAIQTELQSNLTLGSLIPVQALQALPYGVTLLVLVGFIGRAKPPEAIGTPD
jgi:general nucleoside transport system permease protein